MTPPIRVLVVDDSAFIRKVVRQMLSTSPDLAVVGIAGNGAEALAMVESLRPDVITLDLNMPGVDGVEFLRRQMAVRPIPVVVCSVTHETSEAAVAALELGAVDFVQKPTALATDLVYDLAGELVAKVKAAAVVDMNRVLHPAGLGRPPVAAPARATSADLIVVGVSTGGPQALRSVVPRLPHDFPVPIAVVLHMPVGYTTMYAQRLNSISEVDVVEVGQGEHIVPGRMFLAPAGQHLRIVRGPNRRLEAALAMEPAASAHRPSVDVLFESAAVVCGSRAIGVVLTGMGSDGLAGSRRIKAQGGRVVTEAASSCVVYGMPRTVEEAGLSDYVTALDDLPNLLAELV
jgi:two-component system, chemotaxis family, protein-glutamate methylesterase/glutaminase